MSKRIINATGPQTSFNYGVNGARLYFNYYVEYEEPSGAGTINPSTLNTTLVYQKPGPLNTIQYVESAKLQADGTWKSLRENEARVINPPSPGNPNGSIGNVVNPNSTNYVLGESTRKELVAKGPNTLNYAARQNAAAVVDKSTSLTLNQVNQAYYISQSTAPGGAQINPVLPLSPALPPAPPLSPGPGADPGSGGGADPQAGTDISGATLTSFSENEKANTLEGILRYPKKHTGDYDYLMIQPIEYVPGFGGGSPSGPTIERASKRISRQKTSTGPRIYLPMTSGISESNSVGWGSDELNPINLAFGKAAFESINALATTNLAKGIQDAGNAMTTAVKSLITGNNNNTLQTAVASYFAGQAVGANFLGRSGIVLNPNLELLFQGPKLRSFRYNFRFTPRDADEAKEIRRIIKTFKKTMAVRQSPGSLFLGVPSIYELRYIYNSDETGDHPFLNKIKPCALTAFNVNYTPDGSYMTYQDGSMTSYTVDMQFDEIEPIYNEDIDDVDGPTMGY
jgi:hypothetical protein